MYCFYYLFSSLFREKAKKDVPVAYPIQYSILNKMLFK